MRRAVVLAALAALAFGVAGASGCRHTVGPTDGGVFEGEGEAGEGEGEGGCPSDPVFGLIVPVVDDCTTFFVCGADVTISEAGQTETLEATGSTQQDCSYQGAADKPGTYEIDVTKDGYQPFSLSNIVVDQDDCGHAVQRTVTVRLKPVTPCG